MLSVLSFGFLWFNLFRSQSTSLNYNIGLIYDYLVTAIGSTNINNRNYSPICFQQDFLKVPKAYNLIPLGAKRIASVFFTIIFIYLIIMKARTKKVSCIDMSIVADKKYCPHAGIYNEMTKGIILHTVML